MIKLPNYNAGRIVSIETCGRFSKGRGLEKSLLEELKASVLEA